MADLLSVTFTTSDLNGVQCLSTSSELRYGLTEYQLTMSCYWPLDNMMSGKLNVRLVKNHNVLFDFQ